MKKAQYLLASVMVAINGKTGNPKMGSKPIGISASRGAAVLGLNGFQSKFEIWQILKEEFSPGYNASRGYTLPPSPDNAAIRWGSAFEDAVIELSEISAGSVIASREFFYELEIEKLKITCHIDGMYTDYPTDGKYVFKNSVLHEGKTTSDRAYRAKWGTPGTDRIPVEYQVQVQHQMMCTHIKDCILSVLVFPKTPDQFEEIGWYVGPYTDYHGNIIMSKSQTGGVTTLSWATVLSQMGYFHHYPVEADGELQELMKTEYLDFWNRYIIGDAEPEPENIDDIKRAFPEPVGSILASKEMEDLIDERKLITKEIGASGHLSKRKDAIKIAVLNWMRLEDKQIDDESREKTIIYNSRGHKIASYNGKTFR